MNKYNYQFIYKFKQQLTTCTMKTLTLLVLILVSISVSAQREYLFNGVDLSNWKIVTKPTSADIDTVFYVEDSVINIKGKPFGYIKTLKEYENYDLHVEWRWVEKPKNSGVLLHVVGQDSVWPQNVEAQLWHTNAGDLVLLHEGAKATIKGVSHINKPGDKWWNIQKKFEESSENTPGEWNSYDITCENASVMFTVNGVLQHTATDVYPNKGYIGFQGEGAWIQFRNIYIEEKE